MDAARAGECADINAPGREAEPLVMAITNGHYDLAMYLLGKNADPNTANLQGLTALYAVVDVAWGLTRGGHATSSFARRRPVWN
jgi:hypothetical protein